jgi:uroporphyrinogen-III decarboxylase
LLLGSPEKVKREAIECINKGGLGGGFMLGANCVVPRDTPTENMRALTEAILEAGDYPITI